MQVDVGPSCEPDASNSAKIATIRAWAPACLGRNCSQSQWVIITLQTGMDPEPLVTIPIETLSLICSAVDGFASDVGGLIDTLDSQLEGAPGSRSALERAQHGQIMAHETVGSQAALLLEAAGDYLFAVPRLLTEPAMAIAPWACARGVLESCSQLSWLLDPRIAGTVRLSRSLALRFRGVREQLKLYEAERDTEKVDALLARIQLIRDTADARGIEVHSNAKGHIDRVGEKLPSATALAGDFLNAANYYRLLSAVTHSQGAFILASSFKATDKRGRMEKSLSTDVAAFLLLQPTGWFARAAWRYLSYLGFADDRMIGLLEAAYDKLGLGPPARFWRGNASKDA